MSGLQIFGLVAFLLLLVICVGSFSLAIKFSIDLVKDRRQTIDYKLYYKKIGIPLLAVVPSFILMMLSIFLWNGFGPGWESYLQVIFGGLIFSTSIGFGTCSFIVHYYKKELPKKLDKCLFWTLVGCVAVCFISFLLLTDGFTPMCGERFLLPNGLNFTYGFVRPDSGYGANIAFYAICILSGAIFVYFLCDHKMYLEYGKHGTLEATFLAAFPAGIVGARIAYVIGEWNNTSHGESFAQRCARGEWWSIFAIWEGGLTILGGAIVGIVVGVLVYMGTNKKRSIWRAIDIIVPTILIAQAVGRWGNFFNCEVHGGLVPEEYWGWVPKIVFNNAHYSSTKGWAESGFIYAPLFLIEAMVNMLGYFVLAHVFGDALKKWTKPGDLCFGYVIWYGFTRTFMEPLRDASFNMGTDGYWSWFWSLIFVAVGTIAIIVNHLVREILSFKKKEEYNTTYTRNIVGGSVVLVISLTFIIVGSLLMANNPGGLAIALNNYNIGIIMLVVGCSSILATAIPISHIVFKTKQTANV